jgi:predicted kinase
MIKKGILHFFCGKMAAGKTTKSLEVINSENAILISEDDWLGHLFKDEIKVFGDYIKYSKRLKPLLSAHIKDIIESGVSVVMDFPANTIQQRSWFKELIGNNNISHQLHYLEASDELCLKQLAKRSEGRQGEAFTSEEEFHTVNSYFQAPAESEGFNIKTYKRENA